MREGSGGMVWARGAVRLVEAGQRNLDRSGEQFFDRRRLRQRDVSPRAGGGSRIHVDWNRRGKTLAGKLVVGLIVLLRGMPVRRSVQAGLDRMAAQTDADAR